MVVDGSKPSIDAVTQARDIAKKLGAELIALYVISPDIRHHYLEDTVTPKLPEALRCLDDSNLKRGEACRQTREHSVPVLRGLSSLK